MIRILHILSSVNKNAGVPNTLMNYYRHMDRKKVQFDFLVYLHRVESFEEEILLLGGNVYYIRKPALPNLFAFKKDLDMFFKDNGHRFGAIQLHDLYLNMVVYNMARRHHIHNLIAHSHTTMYSDKKLSAARNFLLFRGVKANFPIRFGCSRAAGEFVFGRKPVKNGDVKIINNAIDINKFVFDPKVRCETRAEFGMDECFVVGHIGMFLPVKNHAFILDIFNEIKKIRKKSKLLLIGDGILMDQMKAKAGRMGMRDDVLFLGNRKDVSELLQAADAFIMPSIHEGLPLSAIEAQSAGLRCVLSDTISREAVVHNVKQFSLSQSASDWARLIVSYCSGYKRENCFDILKKSGFDIVSEAENLQEFYLDIVQ